MFSRKIYSQLVEWKKQSQGKTALLIEGARRVGKSTVAQQFAQQEYRSHILIDFSIANTQVKSLFDDLSDLDYLFLQLQLLYGVNLYRRESLIIFDEVQFCPRARQAIKHLVKDGRYDYLETGSLVSIRKNVKDILIPSEETRIQMFPLDYQEFCQAIGEDATTDLLAEIYLARKPLGSQLHHKMMRQFRLYMLVGGMPQAVSTYLETNNFKQVDRIKRNILELYRNDFYKIDPTGKTSRLFDSIPAQLEKDVSRYQVSGVLPNERATSVAERLAEMESSKTVLFAQHVQDPNVGLSASVNADVFKMFLTDTGLFVTACFKDQSFTDNVIYQKLLSNKLPANLGYLFENIVAQTLASKGYGLFYYTFAKPSGAGRYEVDFLLPSGSKIQALEVKSSGYRRQSSLQAFTDKFSSRVSEKIVVYTKDFHREAGITYLPVYLAQFL